MQDNQDLYEKDSVVKRYLSHRHLQPPEQTILNIVEKNNRDIRMLDIGVGAGRTTHYFAPIAKEYVGVDYSKKMIDACIQKFQKANDQMSFHVCDARAMNMFESNSFDFVLFSFNGIDMLSHEDRFQAFREMKRVCKPDGLFCFSSHNLQSVDELFKLSLVKNPVRLMWGIYQIALLRLLNSGPQKLKKMKHAIISVSASSTRFRHLTYFIKPMEQLQQLQEVGFKNVRTFGLTNGQEITARNDLEESTDSWVYYLCSQE